MSTSPGRFVPVNIIGGSHSRPVGTENDAKLTGFPLDGSLNEKVL